MAIIPDTFEFFQKVKKKHEEGASVRVGPLAFIQSVQLRIENILLVRRKVSQGDLLVENHSCQRFQIYLK